MNDTVSLQIDYMYQDNICTSIYVDLFKSENSH